VAILRVKEKMGGHEKAPIPASRPLSGNLSAAGRQKRRSRSMKALRRHFMKTGRACRKNVSGEKKSPPDLLI
jgi:hypothetical protein